MRTNILLLILGMALVTYIPRSLPFFFIDAKKIPSQIKNFLSFIPYTALGALIFPGVFSSIPAMPIAAIIGISFTILYTWRKGGIIIPVIGTILVTFLILSAQPLL